MLSCSVSTRNDSLNVLQLFELYSLLCMMNGDQIDPGYFLLIQFYSAATSTVGTIVIGGIITPIAGSLGV